MKFFNLHAAKIQQFPLISNSCPESWNPLSRILKKAWKSSWTVTLWSKFIIWLFIILSVISSELMTDDWWLILKLLRISYQQSVINNQQSVPTHRFALDKCNSHRLYALRYLHFTSLLSLSWRSREMKFCFHGMKKFFPREETKIGSRGREKVMSGKT